MLKRPATAMAQYARLDLKFKESVISSGSTGAGRTAQELVNDELLMNPNEGDDIAAVAVAYAAVAIGAGASQVAEVSIAAAAAATPS